MVLIIRVHREPMGWRQPTIICRNLSLLSGMESNKLMNIFQNNMAKAYGMVNWQCRPTEPTREHLNTDKTGLNIIDCNWWWRLLVCDNFHDVGWWLWYAMVPNTVEDRRGFIESVMENWYDMLWHNLPLGNPAPLLAPHVCLKTGTTRTNVVFVTLATLQNNQYIYI